MSMCGLTLWNRVKNEEVRRRAQVAKQLSGRVDQCVLRWFGHVEGMDEEHMAKKVMNSDTEGNRCRSRPRLGWMDGARMKLVEKGMSRKQGRLKVLERRRWELIVRSE